MSTSLRDLASFPAPESAWADIRQRLEAQVDAQAQPAATSQIAVAATVCAVLLTTIATVAFVSNRSSHDRTATAPAALAPSRRDDAARNADIRFDWIAQSKRLDDVMRRLPQRPRVERLDTAAAVDALQSRIQWLDYQLSYAADVGLTERQTQTLWQDRVQLMDSLVKVRYVETQSVNARNLETNWR